MDNTLPQDPAFKQLYFEKLISDTKNYENGFHDYRKILINFIGLVILGGLLIAFQDNMKDQLESFKKIVVLCYLLALIFILFSYYLLINDHRTWQLELQNYINTFNTQSNFFVPTHKDFLYTIISFISIAFFLAGTLFGAYAFFKCSWEFAIAILVVGSIFTLAICIECVFHKKRKTLQA